jgi:hypothetical protein
MDSEGSEKDSYYSTFQCEQKVIERKFGNMNAVDWVIIVPRTQEKVSVSLVDDIESHTMTLTTTKANWPKSKVREILKKRLKDEESGSNMTIEVFFGDSDTVSVALKDYYTPSIQAINGQTRSALPG